MTTANDMPGTLTVEALVQVLDRCIAGETTITPKIAGQLRDALQRPAPSPLGGPIPMIYRNWRGEVAPREVVPTHLHYGSTNWHPEPGWLLAAYDLEKMAHRDFALADCQFAQLTGEEIETLDWKQCSGSGQWNAETAFGFYTVSTVAAPGEWSFGGRDRKGVSFSHQSMRLEGACTERRKFHG